MHHLTKSLLAGCAVLCLGACASGPSNSEAETAMKARINDMDAGDHSMPTVESAKNVRCTPMPSKPMYTCTLEVVLKMPAGARMHSVAQLQMVQADGGWTYDKDQVVSMQASSAP